MADVREFPTDASAVAVCLEGAKGDAKAAEANWAIVILPAGESVMICTSHTFSHPRLAGLLEEAKAVSVIAEIESQLGAGPDAI